MRPDSPENRATRNPRGHALRMAAPFNWPGNSMTCLVFADAGREADLVAGTGAGRASPGRRRPDPLKVDLVGGEQHADEPCSLAGYSPTITVWSHHGSAPAARGQEGEVGGRHRVRARLLVGEPGHSRTTVSRCRPGKPASSVRSSAVVESSRCSSDSTDRRGLPQRADRRPVRPVRSPAPVGISEAA